MRIEDIPLLGYCYKHFPHMDFEGQKLSEKIYQFVIILFAIVGFIWGYLCKDFAQTVYVIGAGLVLAAILVLPPWPFYRRNPLSWQPMENSSVVTHKKTSKGTKKGKSRN